MPKICFVTQTARVAQPILDPSVRYRCYHPAEALTRSGNPSVVMAAPNFFSEPNFNYDVYFFHRPSVSIPNFDATIAALKRAGKILVADYDDLIFGDETVALQSSIFKNNVATAEATIKIFENNTKALLYFDRVTVSTRPLAREVENFNPKAQVAVVPNFVSPALMELHESLGTHLRKRDPLSIGYFAGTKSHDKDFPIVAEPLYRVLIEDPRKSLTVVGPVELPKAFAMLPNVVVAPVVNYLRLPGLMTRCSTVIAPLESSRFNSCKSRVKFLEASLGGCRLLATPIPDMREVGEDKIGLMENLDDWYQALSNPTTPVEDKMQVERNFAFIQDSVNTDSYELMWS